MQFLIIFIERFVEIGDDDEDPKCKKYKKYYNCIFASQKKVSFNVTGSGHSKDGRLDYSALIN